MSVYQFLLGIFAALGAGALWGLSYVLPLMVPSYSPIEIILGRYLVYGILSIYLLRRSIHLIPKDKTSWRHAFIFALTGNILYYLLEVIGIRSLLPSIVALLFCFLPVMVTCYGNFKNKEYPWRYIMVTISLILSGLLLTQMNVSVPLIWDIDRYLGIAATMLALVLWSSYAVNNAKFLRESKVSATHFTSMIGGCCFAIALSVISLNAFVAVYEHHFIASLSHYQHLDYLLICACLGMLVTWLGTVLWNYASATLPITIAGQLLTGEIVFGLIYSYIYEMRSPNYFELSGMAISIFAIISFLALKHHFKLVSK